MEKTETIISKEIPSRSVSYINGFFQGVGVSATIPPNCDSKDFYSDLIRGHFLEVNRVERGKVSCLLSVKAAVTVMLIFPLSFVVLNGYVISLKL